MSSLNHRPLVTAIQYSGIFNNRNYSYICNGKVVHDQLPPNSPRAGMQQG